MIEILTGESLGEFLKKRLFDKIGVTTAEFLKCPGGYSWGDSGMLCTPLDMLKIAKFTINLGEWNGEQILDRNYLKAATSNLIATDMGGTLTYSAYGYGYLIWRHRQDCFGFNGMGGQFAICNPEKNMILLFNGDNQNNPTSACNSIINGFFEEIVNTCSDNPLSEDKNSLKNLQILTDNLELWHCKSKTKSPFIEKINEKNFYLEITPWA